MHAAARLPFPSHFEVSTMRLHLHRSCEQALPAMLASPSSLTPCLTCTFCTLIIFDDCAGLKRLMRGSHPQKVPNAEPVRTCLVLPYWVEMQEVDPMTLELNMAVPDRMLGGLSRAVQSCRLNWPCMCVANKEIETAPGCHEVRAAVPGHTLDGLRMTLQMFTMSWLWGLGFSQCNGGWR